MDSKIPQHKRMAQGDRVGFARGGAVRAPNVTPVGVPAQMVPTPAGKSGSPLTSARRNNGIPGMCAGGGVPKSSKGKGSW